MSNVIEHDCRAGELKNGDRGEALISLDGLWTDPFTVIRDYKTSRELGVGNMIEVRMDTGGVFPIHCDSFIRKPRDRSQVLQEGVDS
jgi:hypothetical protein